MTKNCPLCNKVLMDGSAEGGAISYCPEVVILKGSRLRNHYIEDYDKNSIVYYLLPYRIITYNDQSSISTEARYKTGKKHWYFKTILKCPLIHPDTEERLRHRLKSLLIFS